MRRHVEPGELRQAPPEWLAGGQHHSGIIVSDQRLAPGVIIRAFEELAATLDPASISDQIVFLTNWISPG